MYGLCFCHLILTHVHEYDLHDLHMYIICSSDQEAVHTIRLVYITTYTCTHAHTCPHAYTHTHTRKHTRTHAHTQGSANLHMHNAYQAVSMCAATAKADQDSACVLLTAKADQDFANRDLAQRNAPSFVHDCLHVFFHFRPHF